MGRRRDERSAQKRQQLTAISGGETAQHLVFDLHDGSSGPLQGAPTVRRDRDLPRAAIARMMSLPDLERVQLLAMFQKADVG